MRIVSLLWPRSLRGQVLLAIALALFLAQGIGALLIYRAQHERLEGALVHNAAYRLASAVRDGDAPAARASDTGRPGPPPRRFGRVEYADRMRFGSIVLIIRELDDQEHIRSIGISLEPVEPATNLPIFINMREIAHRIRDALRRYRARARKAQETTAKSE